jgi:hypothetical protein
MPMRRLLLAIFCTGLMLFAAVSRPIAAGDGCEVRLMATLSGRGRLAGIARFSSMIKGAQETDQQYHKVDFDGHSLSLPVFGRLSG